MNREINISTENFIFKIIDHIYKINLNNVNLINKLLNLSNEDLQNIEKIFYYETRFAYFIFINLKNINKYHKINSKILNFYKKIKKYTIIFYIKEIDNIIDKCIIIVNFEDNNKKYLLNFKNINYDDLILIRRIKKKLYKFII